MKSFATTAIAAVALASLAVGVGLAQPKPDQSIITKRQTSDLKNGNVETRYKDWEYQGAARTGEERGSAGGNQRVSVTLKLKQTLTSRPARGMVNAFYDYTDQTVHLCYEILDWIENVAAVSPDKRQVRPPTASAGPASGRDPGRSHRWRDRRRRTARNRSCYLRYSRDSAPWAGGKMPPTWSPAS
jgi:hypothetical protein